MKAKLVFMSDESNSWFASSLSQLFTGESPQTGIYINIYQTNTIQPTQEKKHKGKIYSTTVH